MPIFVMMTAMGQSISILATVTPQIVQNFASFTVKYYLSQADAIAGNNNTLPANWSYTSNTTVYVRVESTNGCPPAFGQIDFKIKSKVPFTDSISDLTDLRHRQQWF